ncbi:MAG: hypothetical protein IJY60_11330, partial [Bacteroides sp.]|nr:hypothetical protein [Bacteroides sp.]
PGVGSGVDSVEFAPVTDADGRDIIIGWAAEENSIGQLSVLHLDEVVDYVVKQEAKEGEMGPYAPEDVFFVVQGEMEYGDSLEEE